MDTPQLILQVLADASTALSIPEIAEEIRRPVARVRRAVQVLVDMDRVEPLGWNYTNAQCYGLKEKR